ncbi:MAG: hypothetical protein KDI79_24330 [Anaerolineae bacterium]|nr:hypothetical protein [Anaerolineae bacterium]
MDNSEWLSHHARRAINRPGYEQRPLKTRFSNSLERVLLTSPVDLSPVDVGGTVVRLFI